MLAAVIFMSVIIKKHKEWVMSPDRKAYELFHRFQKVCEDRQCAKEAALIMVDTINSEDVNADYDCLKYWKSVRVSLERISVL
jgi:hypothetical protein